jgi:hypothetical protein
MSQNYGTKIMEVTMERTRKDHTYEVHKVEHRRDVKILWDIQTATIGSDENTTTRCTLIVFSDKKR